MGDGMDDLDMPFELPYKDGLSGFVTLILLILYRSWMFRGHLESGMCT